MTALNARQAYLDGELCGTFPNGITLVQHNPGRGQELRSDIVEPFVSPNVSPIEDEDIIAILNH